ncbi:MAG: carboxypeptidase regulatory-like domain-containing protein [Chitinophagales bacterium]|nr:carboxypeptidase regulatory-like domain-containing protein [Chitinophagales bacterium]
MFFTTFFAIWLSGVSAMAAPAAAPLSAVTPLTETDSVFCKTLQTQLSEYRADAAPEKMYLSLDKTLLQPGEYLWFCAYIVNAGNLQASLQSQVLYVELHDMRGYMLSRREILALEGVGAGEFYFPPNMAGGQYKIKAFTHWMGHTRECFERSITLQHTVLPNVNLELRFERKAVGPGEVAIARFNGHTIQNKPLAAQKLNFTVQLAGKTYTQGETSTDEAGQAFIRFTLPEKLESADGLLNVQLLHQGQQEAISRPVPITLHQLDLQFFPESGQAIAGFPCRMAFKCLNAQGKPADVEGAVVDSKGRVVTSFRSFHDGMGAFDFTPRAGETYAAQLLKPFAADTLFPIPEAELDGISLHLLKQDAQSLSFQLRGNHPGKLFLVGTLRDELCCFVPLETTQMSTIIEVPAAHWPMGIARITLMDENRTALAERLVFVGRNNGLNITMKTDKQEYMPREEVNLSIQVNDHAGKPVKGHFSLSVVDEKLLNFADDKQGNILASLLLEQEVKGVIEEPNFYFDPAEPQADQALDYLLLTQGWRRFTWSDILDNNFYQGYGYAERAVIAGRLYQSEGVPAKKKKIRLHPNGESTITNQEGYFSFKNVDLSKYTGLYFDKDKYMALFHYTDDLELYIKEPEPLKPGVQCVYEICQDKYNLIGLMNDGVEPLVGATIKVMKGGEFVRGAVSDYDGFFRLALEPGEYEIGFYSTGFTAQTITKVKVSPTKRARLNVTLGNCSILEEVTIVAYKIPQDEMASAQTLSREQIQAIPVRKRNALDATTPGVSAIDGGEVNIRGSRSNNVVYYVDGIRINTLNSPPVQDWDDRTRRSKHKRKPGGRHFDQARMFYVPRYAATKPTEERTDFRSTIYWNPVLETDQNGSAKVTFYTSDAITNFRASLEGLSVQGSVGRAETSFFVQKTLSIQLKAPAFVMVGDLPAWQIAVSNKTAYPAGGFLRLRAPEHFTPLPNSISSKGVQVHLAPGETKVLSASYAIGFPLKDDQVFQVQLYADEVLADAFEARIRTENPGFPMRGVAGGKAPLSQFDVSLIEPVQGTVRLSLNAYPSVLDNVIMGMERMLRQPVGCFEQVSSSNYPNLLVLDLLRTTNTIRPEVELQAMKYLEEGYQKLTGYESASGGFDWYGRDPGHEVLTAYGLLEFTDMKKVFPVDPALLSRTTRWLYSRRNGKGGWLLNPGNAHGWKSGELMDAYIAWAVAEAGAGQLFQAEIAQCYANTATTEDSYLWALLANTLSATRDARTGAVLDRLLAQQQSDGSWTGKSVSVFFSQGAALSVEATALAMVALMRNDRNSDAVERGMLFLLKSQGAFGFGNTQSTVLALRALTMYAQKRSEGQKDGVLTVEIAGKKVAEQTFSTGQIGRLNIQGLEQYLTGASTPVTVRFGDEKVIVPFDLEWHYMSKNPPDAPGVPFSFTTDFNQSAARIGETVRLQARLTNLQDAILPAPMMIIGIPAGLSLQPWQLKKLLDEKHCDYYELWNGFAVFHFERINPKEHKEIALDLRVDMAGSFEAPASQAFLYYQNEKKVFSKPRVLVIKE